MWYGARTQLWLLVLSIALLCRANDLNDDILTILGSANGASTFVSYLQGRTQLIDLLNGGNFTVLVPNDQAFTRLGPSTIDNKTLDALLDYHIVKGIFPSGTFSTTPVFAPTLLNDSAYTNITGGQRVELVERNGVATVLTGLKNPSKVVQADIFYAGGLIQMVDAVSTIPLSLSHTITQAGLEDLTALLNDAGWLAPSPAFDATIALPDLTVFGPNDPRFGASFTGFDGLTDDQRLKIFSYHCVAGRVLYSTDLTNNTHFNTLDNLPITSYDVDNTTFMNNAQITAKDYLTANGVLQVINYLLDPSNSSATPNVTETGSAQEPAKSSGGDLGDGAIAGIAIGGVAVGLILAVAAVFFCRWWRRRRREGSVHLDLLDREHKVAAELGGLAVPTVVEADSSMIFESGGHRRESTDKKGMYEPPPVEIDGDMVQRTQKSRTSKPVTEDWSDISSAGDRG
ncbi:hypothetical protein PV04_07293 [Phialophora macrospora]|uniref:FAS1 domain-containing protein n=1 Tax=Phialophora macrospora TaxID=1851006 RepID=A0A0D2CIJ7_9EURO|nr:hypothetical protein PV04_07293 [Phialophora macrospora]